MASALSELCQQCGLCCNGALFTFLPVSPQEAARMEAHGARINQRRDGRAALLLPCAALRGTCCSAYPDRPARCREYVCTLGRAVEQGERSLDGATAIVAEAKAMLAAVESELDPVASDHPLSVLQRAHRQEATEPGDERLRRVRERTRDAESFLSRYFVSTSS